MAKALITLRKLIKGSLIFSLFTVCLCSQIVAADSAKVFADVLLSIDTMEGQFQQKITDSDGYELQTTDGEFRIKRPGYFWWHVAPPYEQIVVGTPQALKVFDPDLEQMTVHAEESYSGTPAWLISGDVDRIYQTYDVAKMKGTEKNTTTFVLTQKQKPSQESAFRSLSFSFLEGKGKMNLSEMVFIDNLGQKTQIVISGLSLNKELAGDAFVFEPPQGTDIIVDG